MPTERIEIWILGISGLLLLFALAAALLRRRRNRLDPDSDVDPTVAAFRVTHPAFYRIMRSFQRNHDLAEILSQGEVRDSFRLLQLRTEGGSPVAGSPLGLNDPAAAVNDERLQAAMLTILRGIYMEERFTAGLEPEAHKELDRMLDSLTG